MNEYYVCDSDGNIVEKVKAKTLFNMFQSDGTYHMDVILTLMYVDGDQINRAEKAVKCFVIRTVASIMVDPALDFTDNFQDGKIMQEKVRLLMERSEENSYNTGYLMTRKDA